MGLMATLWVKLGLDKKGFDSGADASKKKIKEVGDEAAKTGTKTEEAGTKGSKALGPAMLLGAVTAVVIGFQKLAAAAMNLYNSFGEQERAGNSLAQAIRNNGKNVDELLPKYNAFASEMQRVTNTGDELVLDLVRIAETMRAADPEQAVKGAIALSKAFGIDMRTGIRMATLAQEGNFTMLSRYVPALRTANGVVEQAAIYQKAVADGFAIATDQAKDSIGVVERSKNSWGDLKEVFGEVIASPMKSFFTSLSEWLEDVNLILTTKSIPAWQRWASAITGIGAGVIRDQRKKDDEAAKIWEEGILRLKEKEQSERDYTRMTQAELDAQISTQKRYSLLKQGEERQLAIALVQAAEEETARRKQESDKQLEAEAEKIAKIEELRGKEKADLQALIDGLQAYTQGTENYYNQLIAINEKRIKNLTGGEIRDALKAENQELQNQLFWLGKTAEQRATMMQQAAPVAPMTGIGTPSVTSEMKARPMPSLEMSDQLKEQQQKIKDTYDQMMADAQQFSNSIAQTINVGIVGAFQSMAQSIGETGNIDMGKVLAAILNPLGDLAISTGVLAIGIGEAISGILGSLTSLNPALAIAKGVALIALGVAAKAGAAALAGSGGGGGGAGGSQGMSVVGAGYSSGARESQRIEVVGVLRGPDIYLASKREEERRAR